MEVVYKRAKVYSPVVWVGHRVYSHHRNPIPSPFWDFMTPHPPSPLSPHVTNFAFLRNFNWYTTCLGPLLPHIGHTCWGAPSLSDWAQVQIVLVLARLVSTFEDSIPLCNSVHFWGQYTLCNLYTYYTQNVGEGTRPWHGMIVSTFEDTPQWHDGLRSPTAQKRAQNVTFFVELHELSHRACTENVQTIITSYPVSV